MNKLPKEIEERLEELYPVIFVNNLPANDFIAAADETLRARDRQIMQSRLKSFLATILEEEREAIRKRVEKMLSVFSVKAPEESYAATFTPKQFMSVLRDEK